MAHGSAPEPHALLTLDSPSLSFLDEAPHLGLAALSPTSALFAFNWDELHSLPPAAVTAQTLPPHLCNPVRSAGAALDSSSASGGSVVATILCSPWDVELHEIQQPQQQQPQQQPQPYGSTCTTIASCAPSSETATTAAPGDTAPELHPTTAHVVDAHKAHLAPPRSAPHNKRPSKRSASECDAAAVSLTDDGGEEHAPKKRRLQVERACSNCRRSKTACSSTRPCTRCVSAGHASTCVDAPRKRRRRTKEELLAAAAEASGITTAAPSATTAVPAGTIMLSEAPLPQLPPPAPRRPSASTRRPRTSTKVSRNTPDDASSQADDGGDASSKIVRIAFGVTHRTSPPAPPPLPPATAIATATVANDVIKSWSAGLLTTHAPPPMPVTSTDSPSSSSSASGSFSPSSTSPMALGGGGGGGGDGDESNLEVLLDNVCTNPFQFNYAELAAASVGTTPRSVASSVLAHLPLPLFLDDAEHSSVEYYDAESQLVLAYIHSPSSSSTMGACEMALEHSKCSGGGSDTSIDDAMCE